MPFIRTTSPFYGLSTMTDDQLLDKLQAMGRPGRDGAPPFVVRAAYAIAAQRGLITPEEAQAGIKEVLRIRLARNPDAGFPG